MIAGIYTSVIYVHTLPSILHSGSENERLASVAVTGESILANSSIPVAVSRPSSDPLPDDKSDKAAHKVSKIASRSEESLANCDTLKRRNVDSCSKSKKRKKAKHKVESTSQEGGISQ